MKREEKLQIIDSLTEKINNSANFYLADIADLNAADTSDLRRTCFKQGVELVVAKNTLLSQAIKRSNKEIEGIDAALKGPTSIMFSEVGNLPAKLIKDFKKTHEKPILKGAYVGESVYVGAHYLETLINIKSKEELVADIIALLQSPIRNVMSSLQSGSNIITGVLKTLSEKEK